MHTSQTETGAAAGSDTDSHSHTSQQETATAAGGDTPVTGGPHRKPIALKDDAFEETVIRAELPVVVDFWSPSCSPCLYIAPALDALAEEFSGRLLVAKVNCDEEPVWKEKLGVKGIPHLLFFHKGKVVKHHVGASPRAQLRAAFEEFLSQVAPAPDVLMPAARVELEEITAAAGKLKDERIAAASAIYQDTIKAAMDEFDAIRCEFLGRMSGRLADEQAALAARGGKGEFDEAIYKLFVELRPALAEAEFKDLCDRQEAAIQLANSPDKEPFKQAFFEAVEAAYEEYDQTVEAARQRLFEQSRAKQ